MKLEMREAGAKGQEKGCILFVHGALHGAWCWEHFMGYFSERGYSCYAMSFRGHGSSEGAESINDYGIDDYVDDLAQAVAAMPGKPIVVAHSLGGMVLQRFLGKNPGSIQHAVFLASMPVGGTGMGAQLKMLLKHPKATMTMVKVNSGKTVGVSELRHSVIFGGRISEGELAEFAPLIKAESTRIASDQAKPSTDCFDVGVPVSIIGSSGDWMFGDQSQNEKAYGKHAVMLDDLCHDMMLDRDWEKAARAVLDAIS